MQVTCTHNYCVEEFDNCLFVPLNYRCDDGNPCTHDICDYSEAENVTSGCYNPPLDCLDGNGCTIDYCENGICKHNNSDCNDDIA